MVFSILLYSLYFQIPFLILFHFQFFSFHLNLFYFLSVPLSGLLSTLIAYKTRDIKYIFLISSIICLLGLILGKIYLIESPRTCYIREKYDDFILNCEYISKINNSQIEFNLWKEKNISKYNKEDFNEKKKNRK